MDISGVLFIPFFVVAATTVVGAPIAAVQYTRWRLRAACRVANGRCGRCDTAFVLGEEQFLVTGVHICATCAGTLRTRVGRGLFGIAVGALSLGALALGAVALDVAVDGTGALRWLAKSGRWWAVAVPSVGVALGTSVLVAVAKQANRIGRGRAPAARVTGGAMNEVARASADYPGLRGSLARDHELPHASQT